MLSIKDIHRIAYITSRGWEYSGHYPPKQWMMGDMHVDLDTAYRQEKDKEEKDKEELDTIPSPPNPEIGLIDVLRDLIDWYHKGQPNNIPHSLFEQIANHINYTIED